MKTKNRLPFIVCALIVVAALVTLHFHNPTAPTLGTYPIMGITIKVEKLNLDEPQGKAPDGFRYPTEEEMIKYLPSVLGAKSGAAFEWLDPKEKYGIPCKFIEYINSVEHVSDVAVPPGSPQPLFRFLIKEK